MPNFAAVLKAEVARLARKEVRAETDHLKSLVAKQRADIAALKRQVSELERSVKSVVRTSSKMRAPRAEVADRTEQSDSLRFQARGLASNRKRLGLSADDFESLIGVFGQTIYSWESGASKPRAKFIPAIASLRNIGRREVAKRIQAEAR